MTTARRPAATSGRAIPTRPAGDPRGRITQATLVRYQQLVDQEQTLRNEREALRQELLARLGAGAALEAGPLTADVQECTVRALSQAKLLPLLGASGLAALLDRIEPTLQRKLMVRTARGLPAVRRPDGRSAAHGWDAGFVDW